MTAPLIPALVRRQVGGLEVETLRQETVATGTVEIMEMATVVTKAMEAIRVMAEIKETETQDQDLLAHRADRFLEVGAEGTHRFKPVKASR